jgi:tetratricopeptide (TPR) repeat protein
MYIPLLETQIMPVFIMKKIAILRRTNDTISLGTALLNAGEEYANNKDYNNALAYYNESGILFKINYEIGTAYNIGNKGCFMQKLRRKAMNQINTAIYLLEKIKIIMLAGLPYLYVR